MHRCWGKSFNFIIWVGWHALSLFVLIHWTLDVIKAHKHRICRAISIAIRISFLLNFKQYTRVTEPKKKRKYRERTERERKAKKGEKNVKNNKNNHEIVVNLVVSHWCSSMFIQEISFFATKTIRTARKSSIAPKISRPSGWKWKGCTRVWDA